MSEFNSKYVEELLVKELWQEALDFIWQEIDADNFQAREFLAELFEAYGLYAFSQDHWMALEKVGGKFASRAKLGMFGNYLWMRDYESAKKTISDDESLGHLIQVLSDQESKFDIGSSPNEMIESLEGLLRIENSCMQKIEANFSIEHQIELIKCRDAIGVIASLISFPKNEYLKLFAVNAIGSADVSRPLSEVIGTAESCWSRTAHASCVLIQYIVQFDLLDSHIDEFSFACNSGHIALEKMFIHRGGFEDLDQKEKELISDISAGLGMLGNFSSFILGGLL